jgi:hypothetical protein
MSTVKEEALESIKTLADNATWDDLFYILYVRKKVSEGWADFKNGDYVTHEEAKEIMLNRWKSSGQNPA